MGTLLYDWGGLNVRLFHVINDVHAAWFDAFMQLGTQVGGQANFPVYLALIAVCGYALAARAREVARSDDVVAWLSVLAVFSVGYVFEGQLIGLLKPWLDFPRPPLALPEGTLHIVGQAEFHHSLPSGHSAFAMLLAASLWPVAMRPARAGLAVFVLWVGVSRISLGAHFPADVLAGFALSLAVVWLLQAIMELIGRGLR